MICETKTTLYNGTAAIVYPNHIIAIFSLMSIEKKCFGIVVDGDGLL